jgi:hypothetical protein
MAEPSDRMGGGGVPDKEDGGVTCMQILSSYTKIITLGQKTRVS